MGFEKQLVIKRILPHLAEDPQFVAMFLAEAKLAAQLNHPNLVQLFDFGEAEGSHFIAMEYIDGPSLRYLLARARDLAGADLARARRAHRVFRRRGARLRARLPRPGDGRAPAPRAPRREPGQHPHQPERLGEAGGLRHRQGPRTEPPHPGRHGEGQGRVHGAGAAPGRAARPAGGPLRARGRALRAVHRSHALRGRQRREHGPGGPVRPGDPRGAARARPCPLPPGRSSTGCSPGTARRATRTAARSTPTSRPSFAPRGRPPPGSRCRAWWPTSSRRRRPPPRSRLGSPRRRSHRPAPSS